MGFGQKKFTFDAVKINIELGVQSDRVSPATYNTLLQMCPESVRKPYSVRLTLPEADPRMQAILDFLDQQGLRLHRSGKLEPNTFELWRHRTYDAEDFGRVEYLQLYHTHLVSQEKVRDAARLLQLPASALRKPFRIGGVLFHTTVVHGTLRNDLVSSGMVGIEFKPVITTGTQAHELAANFWELTSSIRMPRHARPEELVCFNGTPFTGDYSKVVGIGQESRPPELHFRKSELMAMEPVDFALTFEGFPEEHWVVVSQRFYQFCLKHDLKLDWVPVRIDG